VVVVVVVVVYYELLRQSERWGWSLELGNFLHHSEKYPKNLKNPNPHHQIG
jgi:hypothetical protein